MERPVARWRFGASMVLALALIGVAALVACQASLDDTEPVTGVTEVAVRDDHFSPRVIEVPAGTEVTWEWDGRRDHNVVHPDFQSALQRDGTFARRFDAAGTYDYVCTLHGGMTGRVLVTE